MKCKHFFNACSLFLTSLTPTVWTIGYVIPFRTQVTLKKFKCGLAINTMQGREAKHVNIKKYAEHSLLCMFKRKTVSYIPERIKEDEYCYCGHPKFTTQDKCYFCSHPVRLAISNSCESGQIDPLVYQLLAEQPQ